MTFEQFEKASRKKLKAAAKDCFDLANDPQTVTDFQVAKLLESQFYMQELDRRHDGWIATRDLILEVIVILLIGGEIWLGWKQGHDQDAIMDKENAILQKLDISMAATAKTVGESEKTMEMMNSTIHAQLARMSQIQLFITTGPKPRWLDVANLGNVAVSVYGLKIDGMPGLLYGNPIHIRRGDNGDVPADEVFREGARVTRETNARNVYFSLYLRDDLDNEFVASILSSVQSTNGVLEYMFWSIGIKTELWSHSK